MPRRFPPSGGLVHGGAVIAAIGLATVILTGLATGLILP